MIPEPLSSIGSCPSATRSHPFGSPRAPVSRGHLSGNPAFPQRRAIEGRPPFLRRHAANDPCRSLAVANGRGRLRHPAQSRRVEGIQRGRVIRRAHAVMAAKKPQRAGCVQRFGNGHLVLGKDRHHCRQAKRTTFPGRCSARAYGAVRLRHQFRHAGGLHMQVRVRELGACRFHRTSMRICLPDHHVQFQIRAAQPTYSIKSLAGLVAGVASAHEDQQACNSAPRSAQRGRP